LAWLFTFVTPRDFFALLDDVSLSLPHKKNYVISDGIRKDFKLCNETSVSLPETEEVLPVQQQYGGVSGVCKKRRSAA